MSSVMALPDQLAVYNAILEVLENLVDNDLDKFLANVRDSVLREKFTVITKCKLEEPEKRNAILDAMVDCYGIFTIDVVKKALEIMSENDLLQKLIKRCPYKPNEVLTKCIKELKDYLKLFYKSLTEGAGASAGSMDFNKGYIRMYHNEGGSELISEEHEVSQMERDSRNSSQERIIECQDIFEGLTLRRREIRLVLTKGVAGVGKTVLTQKFILDWAEGKHNQDIHLMFPLTFRELNELEGEEYTLVKLMHEIFGQTKDLINFQQLKLGFILDGLDECRLPLDFSRETNPTLTDPNKSAPVEKLLVNLIRGKLYPDAKVWVTTRPAAAKKIDDDYVSMVTDVRGFTDEQKEEFFRKRILDEHQATGIISHIKKARSLFTLCHIPIFCWILIHVFQHLNPGAKLPSTLSQVYIKFLAFQAQVKNEKSKDKAGSWTPNIIKMVWSLAKLAFEQLMAGNLYFSKEDMSQCGLNTEEIDRYSVFKEVLKKERNQHMIKKVYCFIHLSFQEFLAPLHVHHIFISTGVNLLSPKYFSEGSESSTATLKKKLTTFFQKFRIIYSPEGFYRCAIDRALQKTNGELDLVLRFLLGLSLPANQELLEGLLALTGSDKTIKKTVKFIKKQLNKDGVSSEQKLNLLHCLNELHDQSLLGEIQNLLSKEELSGRKMCPADWAALSFILLSSDSDLEEFDLKKYGASEEALQGLLPVLKACTKAN